MQIQTSQLTQIKTVPQNYNAYGKRNISRQPRTKLEIQNWLVSYLSSMLFVEASEIDIETPFDRYGLDSATAIGLTGDLEDWLAVDLEPTLIYDYPSVEALSEHITEQFEAMG